MRWRLAGVSAGLTLVILVVFALIVGRLATDRIRDDFRTELQSTANSLASQVQAACNPACDELVPLQGMALADDSSVRVVDLGGHVIRQTAGAPELGPPRPGGISRVGNLDVATRQLQSNAVGLPVYVQYARGHEAVDETVGRLWLSLGGGVVVGTLLAAFAGLAVAGRAMRPIASLTATAREIATTRDTSRRIPLPVADDEVAELARTLDEMLIELDAARSEAQAMVQRQREFVADASHELRTPLTSILANLELLYERLGLGPEHGEDVEMVSSALRSSRRMRRLVTDLLLLARADAGRLGRRAECDLGEVVAAAVAEVEPLAGEHEIRLHGNGEVSVLGNADELHRLALNLIDNGVRHTPPGSRIDITVGHRDGRAMLEVRDDGPGLPPLDGEGLFARFVRGNGPADLASEAGSGLGLAIVHAVAARHDGDVEAGASPSGGARFRVTLPLVRTPAQL